MYLNQSIHSGNLSQRENGSRVGMGGEGRMGSHVGMRIINGRGGSICESLVVQTAHYRRDGRGIGAEEAVVC